MSNASSEDGNNEISGSVEEIKDGLGSLGESIKKIAGSTYALLFNRPPAQKAVIAPIMFFVSIFVGDFIKKKIDSALSKLPSVGEVVPDGPLFTTDQLVLLGLLAILLYSMYKLNSIENKLVDMSSARTDGGRPPRSPRSANPSGSGDSDSDGTGEGAVVGLIGGAIAGSTGGPAGALAGAVAGAFIGDALEKQSKKSTDSEAPSDRHRTDDPAERSH